MLITIIDVSAPTQTKTAKGGYQSIEVAFKNEQGQTQSKKLMSFSNPSVFKAIQEFSKGDQVEVEAVKDDQGYWQWRSVKLAGGAGDSPAVAKPAATRVTGSNYETPEERAQRQVYIIRQSSISSAIELLTTGAKTTPKVNDILEVAKQFEDFVFGRGSEATSVEESFGDDIPS